MSLCLAGAGVTVKIAAAAFTLAWTHSVEKTQWREDWTVQSDGLKLEEARIEGSGAGMEPPPEARLEDGFYVWTPRLGTVARLILRRAPEAGDWTLCAGGRCDPIGAWLGRQADPVRLSVCAE